MKICIWCTKIFDLGGTKRVVTLLANELVKEHDVTIMVYQDRFKEDRNMYHMSEDIKVDFIDNSEFVNRHHTPAFCLRYLVRKLNAKYGIFNKEKYNDILADAAGVQSGDLELADGTKLTDVKYCAVESDGYMRMDDGTPIRLFTKVTTDGYRKVTGKDGKDYWVMNEEKAGSTESLYTIGNLQVNPTLMQEPSKLGFRLADGSEDKATANALKAAFTEEAYTLNPNVQKKTTFVDYYTDLVSQVANSGYVFRSIYENQVSTVEATQSAREQVIGVSTDEELSNMIKFQNAYNASSRYINVISEMLEHIISTLGV